MSKENNNIGWVCPKCDKVNAPSVLSCTCVPVPEMQELGSDQMQELKRLQDEWNKQKSPFYPFYPKYLYPYGTFRDIPSSPNHPFCYTTCTNG